MKWNSHIFSILLIFLISVFFTGCSNDSSGNKYLIAYKNISNHSTDSLHVLMTQESPNLKGLSPAIGGATVSGPIEVNPTNKFENIIDILIKFFSKYISNDINTYKIVYNDTIYKGLTGLLVIPKSKAGETFPMIALQHPTQVLRKMSPSNFGTGQGQVIVDDQLTIPLALFLGRAGYIVVVADYPGLGDNKEIHPYCTKRLGSVVTSMMNAVLEFFNVNNIKQTFNGEVYLMGYSEGGYATAVTAQDIEQRYSDIFKIKGVAALDGPHSLSETMRNLMLTAGKDFAAPYFLPYVINGFDDAYGQSVDMVKFDKAIVNPIVTNPETQKLEQFNPNLRARLDGSYSASQINNYMMLMKPYVGPKTILTQDFVNALNDRNSKVYSLLKENDSTTRWTPSSQFVFIHNFLDDLVPYNNSNRAYTDWESNKNVTLTTFIEYIPGLGSVHAGALIPAVIRGFLWIDSKAYPVRQAQLGNCALVKPLDPKVNILEACF